MTRSAGVLRLTSYLAALAVRLRRAGIYPRLKGENSGAERSPFCPRAAPDRENSNNSGGESPFPSYNIRLRVLFAVLVLNLGLFFRLPSMPLRTLGRANLLC